MNYYCGRGKVASIQLACARFTVTDHPDFSRVCTNVECDSHLASHAAANAADCASKCKDTAGCAAAELSPSNVCNLYAGTCAETSTPYGRARSTYVYTKPAIFTPVELEHPKDIAGLEAFVASEVPPPCSRHACSVQRVATAHAFRCMLLRYMLLQCCLRGCCVLHPRILSAAATTL
jgi:hypothetical protein